MFRTGCIPSSFSYTSVNTWPKANNSATAESVTRLQQFRDVGDDAAVLHTLMTSHNYSFVLACKQLTSELSQRKWLKKKIIYFVHKLGWVRDDRTCFKKADNKRTSVRSPVTGKETLDTTFKS